MIKKVFISWEEVYSLLDRINEQTKGEIDFVTGVPRGGTLLAILYSHRFNIPYMERPSNHYPRLLILDDIADSGKTFEDLKKDFPNPKYAALQYKDISNFKPDYYGEEIDVNYGWIVYPWEREDSETIQDYLA